MAVLTDAQRRCNAQVQRKRARIENYFATSRSKFEALQQAWAEDEDQLDALVWYAAAVMNRMKDLRNPVLAKKYTVGGVYVLYF